MKQLLAAACLLASVAVLGDDLPAQAQTVAEAPKETVKPAPAPKKIAAAKSDKDKSQKVARSPERVGDPPSLEVHDDVKLEGPLTSADVAGIVFDRHYALTDCWVKNVHASSRPTHIYLQMRINAQGEVIAAGFEPAWP